MTDIDDIKSIVNVDINEEKIIGLNIDKLFKEEELEGNKQDRLERKSFANKIFILLTCFLFISMIILFLNGLEAIYFHLSDTVLITLLATTTADVISIFLFVVRYLFRANQICPHCGKSHTFKEQIKLK
jgi:hypothetical protein